MVKNMNNIIVIGDLNYNLNIFLNTFLKENNEYTINNITKSIGNILNVPIVLSKYDLNVYYFSCVGNDIEGKEIINFLHSNKIRSDYVNILNKKTNNKYVVPSVAGGFYTMTKDMTQGSPLKLILAFAVPLMLGSLFQQFYNLADTIIVGRFVMCSISITNGVSKFSPSLPFYGPPFFASAGTETTV